MGYDLMLLTYYLWVEIVKHRTNFVHPTLFKSLACPRAFKDNVQNIVFQEEKVFWVSFFFSTSENVFGYFCKTHKHFLLVNIIAKSYKGTMIPKKFFSFSQKFINIE